jgi:RNA polymerase sigma-70 factor (sigma-E family)
VLAYGVGHYSIEVCDGTPKGRQQDVNVPWAPGTVFSVVAASLDPPGTDVALPGMDGIQAAPAPWSAELYLSRERWSPPEPVGEADSSEVTPQAFSTEPVGFDSYVRRQSSALLRLAYLLTGDHHRARDLVQSTLTKMLPRWDGVAARGDPHAYVRTVMVHTALGWRRRKWQAEQPTGDLPDRPVNGDPVAAVADRERLRRALGRLPPRQRAAVVLRHYEDLSEAQAAAALGCSIGTVKTHTARGLDRLRTLLTDD